MEMRRTIGVIAIVGIVLTACAQSSPSPRVTGAVVAPAPSFVSGGKCLPAATEGLPADAGCVTSLATQGDRLFVYASTNANGLPTSWHIRFQTEEGTMDRALHAGTATSYPRVVATTDVDRDGDPDWWIKARDYTSHGAPWAGLYLFIEIGDSIAPVRYQGSALVIDVGGISRRGDGAVCRDGDLVLLRADAQDPQNRVWATSQRRFTLHDARADLTAARTGTLRINGYNDPDLDPYYEVQCYGTDFGVFPPRVSP